MFTTLEIHDVNLPNLFYCLTAQYHNDLNSIFGKLLTGRGKSAGRVGWDCRGCVLRHCRPSCLQGPGCRVGLLQVGGWQVGGSREVCGAWRIVSFRYRTFETQYGSSQIPEACQAAGALLFLGRQYILTSQQLRGVQGAGVGGAWYVCAGGHVPGLVACWR